MRGDFLHSIGGLTRNYLAKLDNVNGAATTWDPGANGGVQTIAISGNDIYAGGEFTSIGGWTRNNIAKLNNSDGAADPNWDPDANGFVRTIAISSGDIYAGGEFTSMKNNLQPYLALFTNRVLPVELTCIHCSL